MSEVREQVRRDIELLKNYNKDENHIITLPEIVNYFKSKGSKIPLITGTIIFRAIDKNHDMKISVDELQMNTINSYINSINNFNEIEIEAFIHQFDKSQHQKVEINQMIKYLKDLGMENANEKVTNIFKQLGNENEQDIEKLRNYFRKNYLSHSNTQPQQ